MSRQRFIHPAIFTSEDFVSLSPLARLLWIGLFTLADDHGRGHASPVSLKASIFPADDIDAVKVVRLRNEIQDRGMVQIYESAGKPYYLITKWRTYQRPTWSKPTIIPDPPEEPAPSQQSEPIANRSPIGDQLIANRSPIGDVGRDGLGWIGSDREGLDREGKGGSGRGGEPEPEVEIGGRPASHGQGETHTPENPADRKPEEPGQLQHPNRIAAARMAQILADGSKMENTQSPGENKRRLTERDRAWSNHRPPKRSDEQKAWEVVTLCLKSTDPPAGTANQRIHAAVKAVGGWEYLGMIEPGELAAVEAKFLEAYRAQTAQAGAGR